MMTYFGKKTEASSWAKACRGKMGAWALKLIWLRTVVTRRQGNAGFFSNTEYVTKFDRKT